MWEANWIRWLLQDFEITEHTAPQLDAFNDNSVYVLSSINHKLSRLPCSFLDGLKRIRRKGLFHLSDEWFSGGYENYLHFDFVLRNYYSRAFSSPGIMTVPLGPIGGSRPSEIKSVTDRRFLWSFAGNKSAARMAMLREFEALEPNKWYLFDGRNHQPPPLDRRAFESLLADTIFSPCPMGNVVLETFRVYESLEMGCIPIVERRKWLPYYDLLMPGNPLPAFSSWRTAKQFVEQLCKYKSGLADYQRAVMDWWQMYKARLRKDAASFVSLGLDGLFQKSLTADWYCRKGLKNELWRISELLKHATRASLQERIGITLERIVGRFSSAQKD